MNGTIFVRFDLTVQVVLPEGIELDGNDELLEPLKERAIEAAVSAFNNCEIYLDGEDKEPTQIIYDVSDSDVQEVYAEDD